MLEISSFHGVFGVFDLELGHELVLRGSVLGSPNALSEPLSDGGHVRPLLSDKFAVEQHSLIGHLKGTDAGDELVAGERVVVTLDQRAVTVVHGPQFGHLVGQRIYFRAQGLVNRSRNSGRKIGVLSGVVARMGRVIVAVDAVLDHNRVFQRQFVTRNGLLARQAEGGPGRILLPLIGGNLSLSTAARLMSILSDH